MKDNKVITLDMMRDMLPLADAIREATKDHVARIAELSESVATAKNVTDAANTDKGSIWQEVFAVAESVEAITVDAPQYRHELFTNAMAAFIIPKTDDAGKPLKLSTAGQYASTGRKLLVHVTASGDTLASYSDKSVADVRKALKPAADAASLERIGELAKRLRYAVKGKKGATETANVEAAIAAAEAATAAVYNAIKTRRDAESNKGKAAVALPELKQEAPAEAGTVETIAADLAADGQEEAKQAVGQ